MKQLILMIAAILCMFAALLLLCGASGSPAPYVGAWRIDPYHTQDPSQLYLMFGSSLRQFGAQLNIRADGTIDYYIGLTGGAGAYSVEGSTLTADLISYAEGNRVRLRLEIVTVDGITYLVYPFRDEAFSLDIWWINTNFN